MDADVGHQAGGALSAARTVADHLFAAALETDASPLVPRANLDLLAQAGLYGVAGPGGLDPVSLARVVETVAGGCLTTALVWLQHHTAVRAVAAAGAGMRTRWLAPLCAGSVRAGIALGGLFGANPVLRARAAGDGWLLSGESPWVTGWGRVDVLHVAARAGADVVYALVDAAGSPALTTEPADLVAVNAGGTVTLRFTAHRVPADRILAIRPYEEARAADSLWLNGALSLGVAARCLTLLPDPSTRLAAELAAARAALHAGLSAGEPARAAAAAARADAAALANRAAAALVVATGSRSLRLDQHAQRLAREALFLLVFGTRPAMRTALLNRLSAC
jgi:hypothetical protein